jgi:hypothetical protein
MELMRSESFQGRQLMRRAEVLSTSGAAVLGAGVGLLLDRWLAPLALPLLLAGMAVHAWGMYSRHRLESDSGVRRAKWEGPLYWLCWIGLVGLVAYAFLLG